VFKTNVLPLGHAETQTYALMQLKHNKFLKILIQNDVTVV